MKKPRIYVDTSVFGGVFDGEFVKASVKFFERIEKNDFTLVTSQIVRSEIQLAPKHVQNFFDGFVPMAEIVDVNLNANELGQAYLKEGIVTKKSRTDAVHVALATVHHCSLIVSWNFKHIVNFDKITKYNAVNMLNGYAPITILSPLEVIAHD